MRKAYPVAASKRAMLPNELCADLQHQLLHQLQQYRMSVPVDVGQAFEPIGAIVMRLYRRELKLDVQEQQCGHKHQHQHVLGPSASCTI